CLFSYDFEALILHREVVHFKAGSNTWTHMDTRTMTFLLLLRMVSLYQFMLTVALRLLFVQKLQDNFHSVVIIL
ncbi:unnamed protein product, partial [Prunus brigantina]